jgi:hypothetical protein
MKTRLIALTLLTLSSLTAVAHADMKQNIKAQDYTYSTKLDVDKVVSTPELNFCGVRPVEMTYIDHMGKAHTVRYEVNGTGCLGDN